MEENGGLNLYGFVSNNPNNAVDDWGLAPNFGNWQWTYDGSAHLKGTFVSSGQKTYTKFGNWRNVEIGWEGSGYADLTLDSSIKQQDCTNNLQRPKLSFPVPHPSYDPEYGVGFLLTQDGANEYMNLQQSIGLYTKIVNTTIKYDATTSFPSVKVWHSPCGCFVGSAQAQVSVYGKTRSISPAALIVGGLWALSELSSDFIKYPEPVFP